MLALRSVSERRHNSICGWEKPKSFGGVLTGVAVGHTIREL
jgi:hypothetical protein